MCQGIMFLTEHKIRTIAHVEECTKEAEESGGPVYGVKGMSMLSSQIDITEAVGVDYMYAALKSFRYDEECIM